MLDVISPAPEETLSEWSLISPGGERPLDFTGLRQVLTSRTAGLVPQGEAGHISGAPPLRLGLRPCSGRAPEDSRC